MNILYDAQAFDVQEIGGVSNAYNNIINNIKMQNKVNVEIALEGTNNIHLHTTNSSIEFKKQQNYTDTNRQKCIEKLKLQNFDIFHPTHYDPYFLNSIGNKPFVFLIHDMVPERLFNYTQTTYGRNEYIKEIKNKQLLVNKASKIIAISEHTKNDIIDIYKIPENKVVTIYHGYNEIIYPYKK